MEETKERYVRAVVRQFPIYITANGVTYFRMILAVWVYFLYKNFYAPRLIPFLVAVSVVTDLLDGPLARERGQESAYGANIDPIADKMIILPVLYFEFYSQDPGLVALLILGDLLSTFMRFIASILGFAAPANRLGKWKMVLQSFALVPIFAGWNKSSAIILLATLLFGIFSIFAQFRKVLK